MHTRRLFAPAAITSLAVLLAACGSDDATSVTAPPATVSTPPSTAADAAELSDEDVVFSQGMIAHHEQAIEMAEIALDPAVEAGDEVLDLAGRVMAAQDPEIDLMTGWLTAAGQPVAMDMSDGHDMSSMDGMMTVAEMDALGAATGDAFDQMWLEMMIVHHEGAIAQAQEIAAVSSNPEVLTLAGQIVEAQQAEISEMQALLDG